MTKEEYRRHNVCTWIGHGEGCRQPTLLGKSYCENHNAIVYNTLLPKTAYKIIELELKKTI